MLMKVSFLWRRTWIVPVPLRIAGFLLLAAGLLVGYSELCGFTIFGLHGLHWSFLGISGRWYIGVAGGVWSAVMFARRVHAKPGLIHILMGASVGLTYIWIMSLSLSHWSWWGLSRYLALGVVASLATKAFNADVKRGTRSRSERATRLARQVSAGNAPPQDFALYLRPFKSTDRLPAAFLPSRRGMGSDGRAEHFDIETVLYRALDHRCELIGLGLPTDIPEGAGRAVVDEEQWQAIVPRLMTEAAFIVIVPFAQPGTLWEIAELQRGGHLGKTIFIMPPAQQSQPDGAVVPTMQRSPWQSDLTGRGIYMFAPSRHHLNMPEEWRNARPSLAELGISLPAYHASGAFFTVSPADGKPSKVAPAPLALLVRQERYIRMALAALGASHQSLGRAESIDVLKELETAAAPTRRTRQNVLDVAMFIYAVFDRPAELAAAAVRMARVTRGNPRIVNGSLYQMAYEVPRNPSLYDGDDIAAMQRWLAVGRSVPGADAKMASDADNSLRLVAAELGDA